MQRKRYKHRVDIYIYIYIREREKEKKIKGKWKAYYKQQYILHNNNITHVICYIYKWLLIYVIIKKRERKSKHGYIYVDKRCKAYIILLHMVLILFFATCHAFACFHISFSLHIQNMNEKSRERERERRQERESKSRERAREEERERWSKDKRAEKKRGGILYAGCCHMARKY